MFIDIFVMWLVLYYSIRIVRSNSRTIQIFKGILLVLIIDGIAKIFGLKTLAYFSDIFLNWGFLAIIIIFQPEIRSLLEKLGKSNVFSRITTLTGDEKENLVDQIVKAAMLLSQDQTGALISIEQSHSLDDFIMTGTKLNSDVTAELLTSIFVTSTPLHDGAVIIQGDKIACASAYFPPTNLELPSRFGARHRAAIGISEITDAVTIVVSEETGNISVTEGGKIFQVNKKQLRDYLLRVICGEETEVSGGSHRNSQTPPARDVVIDDTNELRRRHSEKVRNGNVKKQETSVLSKLAIKKQEEKIPEKVEAEEVIPAETDTVIADSENEKIEELEEELSEIKLPRKKERPIPSYPKDGAGRRFEENDSYVTGNRQNASENHIRPMSAPENYATSNPASQDDVRSAEQAAPAASLDTDASSQRMTPEDVQAARERAKMMYSSTRQSSRPVSSEQTEKNNESSTSQFDTRKIDLTKLMGLNDDLNKTLKMIDSMDDEDSKKASKKGGESL
ncbi:MAG: TIGR00159 family protein [Erysipelotrichia bacterium]|nr:TIGR00159 family protein [Erysipelotrichia bacterium]